MTGTSIDRVLDAARTRGLKVRQLHGDDYMMQCPVHEPDTNPSVHVTYRPGEACTVICDQHDSGDRALTGEVLKALGLDWPDLFDKPKSRGVARDAYSRFMGRLTRGERLALAGKSSASAGPGRSDAGCCVEATGRFEPFTLPDPYVPEQAWGGFSERFLTLCVLLGVEGVRGPFDAPCPVCGEDGALRVLYAPLQQATMFRCKACCATREGCDTYAVRLGEALHVDSCCVESNGSEVMAYDTPEGVTYIYDDGLSVLRAPGKKIRQSGRTRGRHPLWMGAQAASHAKAGHPVFLVEGEKDAAALWACGYAAVTAPGGGGNLSRTLDPDGVKAVLAGADVVAVVDRDETGMKWREQAQAMLRPVAKSLTLVQATGTAHDTSDAIMANPVGAWFELLPEREPARSASAIPETVHAEEPDGDAERERFERFWLEAPYLTRIRDAARHSLTAPWAVFMATLARVSTILPPNVVVPAFVGGKCASLNLFVALVGPSGKGKGTAETTADDIVPDIRNAETAQPGSGEGLVTMFCERAVDESGDRDGEGARSVLRCVNPRALLSVPEVRSLGAVLSRQGSTLAGELTKAWSGEPLGSHTKYKAGTYRAPRYGYRLGLIVGVQYGNAGILFDEADTGLPQRFLWADTQDNPRHAIASYEQWAQRPPVVPLVDAERFPEDTDAIQTLYRQGDRWGMIDHGAAYPLVEVAYPEEAARATFRDRRANLVGEAGEALDAHGNLLRLKVAALLPWLDPDRADPLRVSPDDWRLAGEVLAYSQWVRARCLEEERASRSEHAAETAKLKKTANRIAEEETEELRETAIERVYGFLAANKGGTYTARDIRNSHVSKNLRAFVYDALDALAKESPARVECVEPGTSASASTWRAVM